MLRVAREFDDAPYFGTEIYQSKIYFAPQEIVYESTLNSARLSLAQRITYVL